MTYFHRRKLEILGSLRKPKWTDVSHRLHVEWVRARALKTALNRLGRAL